jgi:hypothetical protein
MNDEFLRYVAVILTPDGKSHGSLDGQHSAFVGTTPEEALTRAAPHLSEANAAWQDGDPGRNGPYRIHLGALISPDIKVDR